MTFDLAAKQLPHGSAYMDANQLSRLTVGFVKQPRKTEWGELAEVWRAIYLPELEAALEAGPDDFLLGEASQVLDLLSQLNTLPDACATPWRAQLSRVFLIRAIGCHIGQDRWPVDVLGRELILVSQPTEPFWLNYAADEIESDHVVDGSQFLINDSRKAFVATLGFDAGLVVRKEFTIRRNTETKYLWDIERDQHTFCKIEFNRKEAKRRARAAAALANADRPPLKPALQRYTYQLMVRCYAHPATRRRRPRVPDSATCDDLTCMLNQYLKLHAALFGRLAHRYVEGYAKLLDTARKNPGSLNRLRDEFVEWVGRESRSPEFRAWRSGKLTDRQLESLCPTASSHSRFGSLPELNQKSLKTLLGEIHEREKEAAKAAEAERVRRECEEAASQAGQAGEGDGQTSEYGGDQAAEVAEIGGEETGSNEATATAAGGVTAV